MTAMADIQNLPLEILDQIITYLDPLDFLSLTATCRPFRAALYSDSAYWRTATTTTFRVPNRPTSTAQHDGALWRKLYRRLQTQTRVYMWGRAPINGNGDPEVQPLGTNGEPAVGVVADLQIGGWCAALLNQQGEVFVKGKLDGEVYNSRGININFSKLKFPDDAPAEAQTIRQLSVGRKHILGLSDSGVLWLWHGTAPPCTRLPVLQDEQGQREDHVITRIVAGWVTAAAYVRGRGLYEWRYESPVTIDGRLNQNFVDNEYKLIPRSHYPSKQKKSARRTAYGDSNPSNAQESNRLNQYDEYAGQDPGQVINFVLLEHYLLFCTDEGQLLVHKRDSEASSTIPTTDFVLDVQGTFRSFAVFTRNGSVLKATQEALDRFWRESDEASTDPSPSVAFDTIPALQNTGVIQVAFGDHHFHALHSNGKITSYGTDPHNSGAFGLGIVRHTSSARGVIVGDHWNRDCSLVPRAREQGRAIWLLEEQRQWADYVSSFIPDSPYIADLDGLGLLSDWMERAGADWGASLPENDDGLGAFFALSVAAGGWAGGALVLVNEELVQAMKQVIARRLGPLMDASGALVAEPELADAMRWRRLCAATANGLPDLSVPCDDVFADAGLAVGSV